MRTKKIKFLLKKYSRKSLRPKISDKLVSMIGTMKCRDTGVIDVDWALVVLLSRATGVISKKKRILIKRAKAVLHHMIVLGLASETD